MNRLVVLFCSFCYISFSQTAPDSIPFENLKEYHVELNTWLQDYESLSEDQKRTFQNKCDEASPYYLYISAKKLVPKDSLVKYDISKICNQFQALEAISNLKKAADDLNEEQDEFETMLDSLKKVDDNTTFMAITTRLNQLKASISTKCEQLGTELNTVKEMEGINEGDISLFNVNRCQDYAKVEKGADTENYVIVGDGEPINVDKLFEQETAKDFYKQVIGAKSTTQLGTFQIPGDFAKIKIYADSRLNRRLDKILKSDESFVLFSDLRSAYAKTYPNTVIGAVDKTEKNIRAVAGFTASDPLPVEVFFKSISFEMRDGSLVDIRLEAVDKIKKIQLYFESRAPVALLNYTRVSDNAYLHFSGPFSGTGDSSDWNQDVLRYLRIRLSDVLKYAPDIGNNFVPTDLTLNLPHDIKEENEDDASGPKSYKLINDSSLKNIIDLRTYTDFLGLFGDESNGLFQIEGKADFYLNPFNFNRSSLYIFKNITPSIRYSRLEEGEDFIATQMRMDTNIEQIEFADETLQLLEKSNLEFGFDLNLANFRLFKESPFWISFHTPISLYNTKVRPFSMADTDDGDTDGEGDGNEPNDNSSNDMVREDSSEQTSDENDFNFSTVGYGLGMNIEVRRLQNFGLNLGAYFKWYSFIGDYSQFNLTEPDDLKTFSLDAEIFYYPGKDESQSIFLRMRTFRDIADGDSAFQQIQFGYRFTLGAGNVKAKN